MLFHFLSYFCRAKYKRKFKRGRKVPSSFVKEPMFVKEEIAILTETKLIAFDGFIVDVIINAGNKILVEVDSPLGISIGQCAEINRFLNEKLDNEANEFELTVSSPD